MKKSLWIVIIIGILIGIGGIVYVFHIPGRGISIPLIDTGSKQTPTILSTFTDKLGSGDTIQIIGPEMYRDNVYGDVVVTHTGYFKRYTSLDLGIQFDVLVADVSGGMLLNPYETKQFLSLTRTQNKIAMMGHDTLIIYPKSPGQSVQDAVTTMFFHKVYSGCSVGTFNPFARQGFDKKNQKSDYEYIGITFDRTKVPAEQLTKMGCDEDFCPDTLCTKNDGLQSDGDATYFYLGKKESPFFMLVNGGQDYYRGGDQKNRMETIQILK